MTEEIYNQLIVGANVLLVGPTDSGKTYYIQNTLIPFLGKNGKAVGYFKDGNEIDYSQEKDFYVFDEVEILSDKNLLEQLHPEEKPYYSDEYLKTVSEWQTKYSQCAKPSLFILTRNDSQTVNFLKDNYVRLEWNQKPVGVFIWSR